MATQSPIQFLDRLRAFNVIQTIGEAAIQVGDVAVELNQDQMYAGLRSDGSEISPFYRPLTITIKKALGQPTDRVTLRNNGNFYNMMYFYVQQDKFGIDSRDSKATDLKTKYKETIFGLTKPNTMTFAQAVQPIYNRMARKKLGLPI